MRRVATVAIAMLLVTTSLAPAVAAHGSQDSSGKAYAGTNVTFDVSERAITDYAVGGEQVLGSVKVQSTSSAENSGGLGVDAGLSAVTSLDGALLSVNAKTEANATVKTSGSATMTAHDNGNGILVVSTGGESQYVQANVSSDATAEAESDSQVSVTTANGTEGSFVVVGDGTVTVNEQGDVSAKLEEDAKLVFRSYPDGKDDRDERQEQLIANGTAAGEVHVMREGGETVTDTVTYTQDTAVTAKQSGENAVSVTVNRSQHEGKVVVTSVSKGVLNAANGLNVTVDGEAAAEASSYGELRSAIGSDQSKYMVRQSSGASAEASADVLVAVNHFSTKTIEMSGSDGSGDGTTDGGETSESDDANDDGTTSNENGQPGFGLAVGVVSLVAAFAARTRFD